MPPVAPSSANDAIDRPAGSACPRSVIVDLPPAVGLLPGEADLIASLLDDVLMQLFDDDDGEKRGSSRRHERQSRDERA
ncbi:hypothetical protein [Sphingomonas adhaesiva]|uniref:hypothetical protein n=1 Tax=Sphingomonas adhaesiva TaxID=28212 RepID=UPI002FF7DE9F